MISIARIRKARRIMALCPIIYDETEAITVETGDNGKHKQKKATVSHRKRKKKHKGKRCKAA